MVRAAFQSNERVLARKSTVKNAAAKSGGISLNDQLLTGDDLLQSLPEVMIRFRLHAVVVMADISDMYMRVQLKEEDRVAQQFLWRGEDRKREPHVYEMTCLLFGAKPSQCSAIYIKDRNVDLFNRTKANAVTSIRRDSCADYFNSSCRTIEEAAQLVRDVIEINSYANFAMLSWVSNDARALDAVPLDTRGKKINRAQFRDQRR